MARIRMQWQVSHRADPAGAALADLHYSRGKIGTPQFVQAGKAFVLTRPSTCTRARHSEGGRLNGADAVWVTTWPFSEYVRHDWGGDYPSAQSCETERLVRVDPNTLEPQQWKGHRTAAHPGFVNWVDDTPLIRQKNGAQVTVRRAIVRETPGTWACVLFRNESGVLSSHLIRQAVAATRAHWGEPPPLGMVTMIQRDAVRSQGLGRCYTEAGFELAGETRSKPFKNVYLLSPGNMPPPRPARGDSVNIGNTPGHHPGNGGSTPPLRSRGGQHHLMLEFEQR